MNSQESISVVAPVKGHQPVIALLGEILHQSTPPLLSNRLSHSKRKRFLKNFILKEQQRFYFVSSSTVMTMYSFVPFFDNVIFISAVGQQFRQLALSPNQDGSRRKKGKRLCE